MFDNNGDNMPPCGVPLVGKPSPSISAFRSFDIREISDLSLLPNDQTCFKSLLWFTLSKKPRISTSIQWWSPAWFIRNSNLAFAWWVLLLGLNP
jgi:hypothetical protein